MNTTSKTLVVVTGSIGAILALVFASGFVGATLDVGLVGDRDMGSIGRMWIPALIWLLAPIFVMISFGAMLIWLTFDHKKRP